MSQFMTINECAQLLRLHQRSVRRYLYDGIIPYVKLSPGPRGAVRIYKRDLERFLQERRQVANREESAS